MATSTFYVPPVGLWTCSKCTYANSDEEPRCTCCRTPKIPNVNSMNGKWTCSACTYENEFFNKKCLICFKAKSDSNSDSQWICLECHFWNKQQKDKCFRCLINRSQIPKSDKKLNLKRQPSKDDIDIPEQKSPKSKNIGGWVFDKFIGKKGPKSDKPEKCTDDLRSSLRAGDLILWQPGKGKLSSDDKSKQKLSPDAAGDKDVSSPRSRISNTRRARRDKKTSGVVSKPQEKANLVLGADLISKQPGQQRLYTDIDSRKLNIFEKDKLDEKWTRNFGIQKFDRISNQQENDQNTFSKSKFKDDLRSSRRAGDLIIWDPSKKQDFKTKRDEKWQKGNPGVEVGKQGMEPFPTRNLPKQTDRTQSDNLDERRVKPRLNHFAGNIKDRITMFEADINGGTKPKFKDDLRSSRRAGDLFVWQPKTDIDSKPKINGADRTRKPDGNSNKTYSTEIKIALKKPVARPRTTLKDINQADGDKDSKINQTPITKKETVRYSAVDNVILKIEEDAIPKIKHKDDLRSSKRAGDLIIFQPDKLKHGIGDPVSKLKGGVVSKVTADKNKMSNDSKSKVVSKIGATPNIIKLEDKQKTKDVFQSDEIPKTKDTRKNGGVVKGFVNIPKSKDLPIKEDDTSDPKQINVVPKPRMQRRLESSAVDMRKSPDDDVNRRKVSDPAKTPKSNMREFHIVDRLITGINIDPRNKRKSDLRSSINAGDLIIYDPEKINSLKGKDRSGGKDKKMQNEKDVDKMREKKPWTCNLCSETNEPSLKTCHRCGTDKPDLSRKSRHSKVLRRRLLDSRKSVKAVDVRKKDERASRATWANIVGACQQENRKFVDEKFPPESKSLYVKQHGKKNPTWLRCQDLRVEHKEEENLEWTVYRKPTSPEDIMQGTLGNCWYLSALAVLAYREDLLEKIIITKSFCPEGAYMVRLCKDGFWKILLIDDLFPTDEYKRLLYSRAKKKQLWVPLIEKAAAKLHGCYEALTSGRTIEALSLLTGEPCDRLDLHVKEDGTAVSKDEKEKIWIKLVNARKSGFLMGTSCGSGKMKNVDQDHYKAMGLISQHAYSLLDVQDVEQNRLVKIRNPWGKDSWKGNWCDASSKWNRISSSRKAKLQLDGNKDGIFWMEFQDYARYFDSVDICKARANWQELRLKGTFPPHSAQPWKFYKLGIIAETQVDIGLFQKSMRGSGSTKEPLVDLLIVVLEDSDDGFGFKRAVTHSKRALRSFVGIEVTLKPGKYTIACLAFKHWHTTTGMSQDALDLMNRDFVLSIHSSMMIYTDEIDTSFSPEYRYLLADCIIRMTMDKGKMEELQPGLKTYSLSLCGGIYVVENSTRDKFVRIKCDYSKSSYLVASRGTFITKDCVPPGHRQVIAVLSPLESSVGWSSQRNISYLLHPKRGLQEEWAPPGVEHVPEITRELAGMYSPRPIQI